MRFSRSFACAIAPLRMNAETVTSTSNAARVTASHSSGVNRTAVSTVRLAIGCPKRQNRTGSHPPARSRGGAESVRFHGVRLPIQLYSNVAIALGHPKGPVLFTPAPFACNETPRSDAACRCLHRSPLAGQAGDKRMIYVCPAVARTIVLYARLAQCRLSGHDTRPTSARPLRPHD